MRRLAPALVLAAIVACGGGGGPRATGDSGIEGLVLYGPTCPVEQAGSPCPDRPYAAEIRIRTLSGAAVETVRSGADGRFRVALPPGEYVLEPVPGEGGLPFGKPVTATVPAHAYASVTVSIDSGIR